MSAVGAMGVSSLGASGGTIVVPGPSPYRLNYVIVGGGGGGVALYGGGGAGGVLKGSTTVLTPNTTYTIVVGGGGGGAARNPPTVSAANGSNSYISTTCGQPGSLPSIGVAYGGGGGHWGTGEPGGSGGGGVTGPPVTVNLGAGVPGQGYPAVSGLAGGGGGGAGGSATYCPTSWPRPTTTMISGPGTPLATPVLPYPILGPIPSYPPSTPAKSTCGLVGGGGGLGGGYTVPGYPAAAIATLGGPGGGGPGGMPSLINPRPPAFPGTICGTPGKVNTGGGAGAGGSNEPLIYGTGGTGGPGTIIISAPTPRIGTAGPPSSFITGTDGAGNTWIQFLSSGTYTA